MVGNIQPDVNSSQQKRRPENEYNVESTVCGLLSFDFKI